MNQDSNRKRIITKLASEKVLKSNKVALDSYKEYKKISDLIDRTNYALGKKPTFRANTGSTLNFEVNKYAISSTTA